MSDKEALKEESSDFNGNQLPCAMYFFKLDTDLRAVSGGKRSLTQPILTFLKLKRERKPHELLQWLPMIELVLGASAIADFGSM